MSRRRSIFERHGSRDLAGSGMIWKVVLRSVVKKDCQEFNIPDISRKKLGAIDYAYGRSVISEMKYRKVTTDDIR